MRIVHVRTLGQRRTKVSAENAECQGIDFQTEVLNEGIMTFIGHVSDLFIFINAPKDGYGAVAKRNRGDECFPSVREVGLINEHIEVMLCPWFPDPATDEKTPCLHERIKG